MGYLIEYKCPECDFKREIHEGSGKAVFARTYMCKDCWDLTTVTICKDDKNVIVEGINRYTKYTLINNDPKQFNCEYCNSNNLEEWTMTHCPRCSSKMIKQNSYWWGLWH